MVYLKQDKSNGRSIIGKAIHKRKEEYRLMEYANAKLYDQLSKFNSFNVNDYVCENGAFTALVSDRPRHRYDKIMFQYGYNNLISLTDGLHECQAWDIDRFTSASGNNYTDYAIIYSNGQQSQIRAYNRELPDEVETDTLIDVRLIDDRHTNIFVDNDDITVCVALDVNRIRARTKENTKVYEYVRKNIPVNIMQLALKEGRMRLMPCVMIVNDKATLGFINLNNYKVIPTFGREVDISPIVDYVKELKKKCNIIYGTLEMY